MRFVMLLLKNSMVLAVLVNRFAPSSRGLKLGMGHRRKPFRAMACLTSTASDMNIVSDWFFYSETLRNDREYREDHHGESLVPSLILGLVLATCIVGTIFWAILATDGRIAAPILRGFHLDKLSIGVTLFLCVLLEDIPQIGLTFMVEDYYEQDNHYISKFAVWNVMASLYDTLIKLAEAFDERNDVVETGVWCKHSVVAHSDSTVTCVLLIDCFRDTKSYRRGRSSSTDLMVAMAPSVLPTNISFLSASQNGSIRLWSCPESDVVQGAKENICRNIYAGHLASVTSLVLVPKQQQFLSGCHRGTIHLWRLDSPVSCRRYLQPGIGVTCLVLINDVYFTAGYQDGTSIVWNMATGDALLRCQGHTAAVQAMCSMRDEATFVTGSMDKTLRLWNLTAILRNISKDAGTESSQSQDIGTMTSLLTSFSASATRLVAEGSNETTEDSRSDNKGLAQSANQVEASSSSPKALSRTPIPSDEEVFSRIESRPQFEQTCEMVFHGHTRTVRCVDCLERSVFISGSNDGTARMWSVTTGSCLKVICAHSQAITAIVAMGHLAFLTGSDDCTIKAWDSAGSSCLRTYTGHTKSITALSVEDNSFASSSNDGTIKLWVLSAVEDVEAPSLDRILDLNDGCCRGIDPS